MGRAHVRRPMRLSGVDEREALVRRASSEASQVGPEQVRLGRDEASAAGTGGSGQQARAEIARAVRRGRQLSARRGPPSERVKNPRPEGFRITAPREALGLRRNGTHNCKSSGRGPGASHPSHQLSGFPREDEMSCLRKAPSVGFADSSPRGDCCVMAIFGSLRG
jgi:hypothetical protein